MRLKIILLTGIVIGIFVLALFGFGVKETLTKSLISNVPEYNCGEGEVCTSCIINGNDCKCNESICECGNETVDKSECDLFKQT